MADDQRPEMEAGLRDIHSMSSEKGAAAIYDELVWQMQSQPEAAQESAASQRTDVHAVSAN